MLRMYQRVMFGELDTAKNGELEDMTRGEVAVLAPLLALIVLLGVYPQPFLGMIETSVATTLERAGFTPSDRAHAPGYHDEPQASSAGAHR
jgi:NADH-quinone oxidoreductase subunit M